MAETNIAIRHPFYQPAMRQIAAITNANPAVVTTTFNHNYITGTIIRLDITPNHGMAQANQLFAPIVRLTPTTFAMAIDTTLMDPFSIPATPQLSPPSNTPSQTIPIGEVNSILTAAVQNVAPNVIQP